MQLKPLAGFLFWAAIGSHSRAKNIIVVGFVHWVEWFSPSTRKVTARVEEGPVFEPTIFGPGRTAWNVCGVDATEKEPFTLACSKPNGHVDTWRLSFKRLKELGIPTSGRYDNTHEEFYRGEVVGFDHTYPLVSFGDRLLRLKEGTWSACTIPGYDAGGKFIEVREDASIVLKEAGSHVFEIANSAAGVTRVDLGRGRLTKALGAGRNVLLVSVADGFDENARIRLWKISGATPKQIGKWNATGAVFASDGQIYRESHGGVDPTTGHRAFFGWTKLQSIQDSGSAGVIRITGDVYVSDIDPTAHRLWGVRAVHGHMGEPFIEANYLTGTQEILIENSTHSVGRYERIAFIESLY
jgi:hypothetical protein